MDVDDASRTRLAVLGSPIAHSKSPAIQAAAYDVLGLAWDYGRDEVTEETLEGYLSGRDASWRGLSLTMPLKRAVLPLLDAHEPLVGRIGAANTVRFTDGGLVGCNTDVQGIVEALRDAGIVEVRDVHVLGAGATAASVLAAMGELGAQRILIRARTPEKAAPLVDLGAALGIEVTLGGFDLDDATTRAPELVVSTLPGGASAELLFPVDMRQTAALFDVAYDPWPSPLATAWDDVGGQVIPGIDMLIHQAIGQIRFWVSGDRTAPLPDEVRVLAAMRAAAAA